MNYFEIPYVYIEDCEDRDVYKAVEAQGQVALAALRRLLDGRLSESESTAVVAWLDVLETMLKCQADPTRHCVDIARYSNGSPVFRLVPADSNATGVEDYLDDADDDFEDVGQLAEYLARRSPHHRVEVNDPPARRRRGSSLLDHLRRAPGVDGE